MAMAVHLGASCSLSRSPLQTMNTTTAFAAQRAHSWNSSFTFSLQQQRQQQHPQQSFRRYLVGAAVADAEPSSDQPAPQAPPKKIVYGMKKGQVVRVDKEKYLDSIEYYAVNHPKYFKGIDYIYEDRGEVLDIRNFEAGEYALVTWAGIPTSPAWLPTYMLIKCDKLSYKRE